MREPDIAPYFNGYNKYVPFFYRFNEGNIYIYVRSQPRNYFGGILYKIDIMTGDTLWSYKHNYSNTDFPEIIYDVTFNEDSILLTGVRALEPYKPNFGINLGEGFHVPMKKVLHAETGKVIRSVNSQMNTQLPEFSLSVISQNPFLKVNDQYYYSRSYNPNLTVLYKMDDALNIDFQDTIYKVPIIYPRINEWDIYSTFKYTSNPANIYMSYNINNRNGLEEKCRLHELVDEGGLKLKDITPELGGYLSDTVTDYNIGLAFKNGYKFISDQYSSTLNGNNIFKTLAIWLDKDGTVITSIPDVKYGNHHYNTVNMLYVTDNYLYLMARPSINGPTAGSGLDILRVERDGVISLQSSLVNPRIDMNMGLFYGEVEDDILFFSFVERLIDPATNALKSYWFTNYGFKAKDFGIEYISNVENNDISFTSLFPNPAQNELNVILSNDKLTNIEVIDIFGHNVQNIEKNWLSNKECKLQVEHLVQGIYFIRISDLINPKNTIVKKWIKL